MKVAPRETHVHIVESGQPSGGRIRRLPIGAQLKS
jgi:hypothetical protein